MSESLHYLLMTDHLMVQKSLISSVKDTKLTPGQPKVLDYLKDHDGAVQKEIAINCHIEPASLTAILNGMENKGYIRRSICTTNRKYLNVFLTELGRKYVKRLETEFAGIEKSALKSFTDDEKEQLIYLLEKLYDNLSEMRKEGTLK